MEMEALKALEAPCLAQGKVHRRRSTADLLLLNCSSPLTALFTTFGMWDCVMTPYLDATDLLRLATTCRAVKRCRRSLKTIRVRNNLQLLSLVNVDLLNNCYPELQQLAITDFLPTPEAVGKIPGTMKRMAAPKVITFQMTGTLLRDEGMSVVTDCLQGLQELQTLSIGRNLFASSLELLGQTLRDGACPRLTRLDLSEAAMASPGSLQTLFQALRQPGRRPLEVLVLSCTPLRASGYTSLCEGRAWDGLQHLHLAHTRPEMEGLAVLTQALADRRFPALRSIDLTYLGLTPEVALNMGRALVMGGLQHQLSSLLLHCNPGVGVEVAYLLRGAGRGLRQVGLRACGLGKGQWKAVCEVLSRSGEAPQPSLEWLDVSLNGLNASDAQAFTLALTGERAGLDNEVDTLLSPARAKPSKKA